MGEIFGRRRSFEGDLETVERLRSAGTDPHPDQTAKFRADLHRRLRELDPEIRAKADIDKAVDKANPRRPENLRTIRSAVTKLVPSDLVGAENLRQKVIVDLFVNGQGSQRGLGLDGDRVSVVPGARDLALSRTTVDTAVAWQLDNPDEPLIATLAEWVNTDTLRAFQAGLVNQQATNPAAVNRYLATALHSATPYEKKLAQRVQSGLQPEVNPPRRQSRRDTARPIPEIPESQRRQRESEQPQPEPEPIVPLSPQEIATRRQRAAEALLPSGLFNEAALTLSASERRRIAGFRDRTANVRPNAKSALEMAVAKALKAAGLGQVRRDVGIYWDSVALQQEIKKPSKRNLLRQQVPGRSTFTSVPLSQVVLDSTSDEAATLVLVKAVSPDNYIEKIGRAPFTDAVGRRSTIFVGIVTSASKASQLQQAFEENPGLTYDFLEAAGPRALGSNSTAWHETTADAVAIQGELLQLRDSPDCNRVAYVSARRPYAEPEITIVDPVPAKSTADRTAGL